MRWAGILNPSVSLPTWLKQPIGVHCRPHDLADGGIIVASILVDFRLFIARIVDNRP